MDKKYTPEKQEISLKYSIGFEQEKEIIEVPFDLPDQVDELIISLKLEKDDREKATIDLGLRDPNEMCGWSGGARDKIIIGKDTATPGYSPRELVQGEWAVLLGAYKIPSNGCEVVLNISFVFHSMRWLKGDLHGHSIHSDGTYTISEILESVKDKGLDFIGLTDHNTLTQNSSYPSQADVLFIPGVELTTYHGHCNLHGLAKPIKEFRMPNKEKLHEALTTARNNGARITLNHPFDAGCEGCDWQWGWDVPYDWIEIWNGPWRDINQRTLDWWHSQLSSGKRIVVVGGSDTHRPEEMVQHGTPTNWVCSTSRSVQGVLQAIDQGHNFITYNPDGPIIDLTCGEHMMGDVCRSIDFQKEIQISLTQLIKGDQIKIISNQREEHVEKAIGETSRIKFNRQDQLFVRVEVWRYFSKADQYLMAALSNPIYFN